MADYFIEQRLGASREAAIDLYARIYSGELRAFYTPPPPAPVDLDWKMRLLRHGLNDPPPTPMPAEIPALDRPKIKTEIGKAARGMDADMALLDSLVLEIPIAIPASNEPEAREVVVDNAEAVATAEEVFAYIAGIAAHPAYTAKFQGDLTTPGLRIPFTADGDTFAAVASTGRRVIWLHTYGERMPDAGQGRPEGAPRVSADARPTVPKDGAIPPHAALPEELRYDAEKQRLHLGSDGYIDHVLPAVWAYEVDGKQVITQWFSYRKRDRSKPQMGDKRPPSPLQAIQPDHWLAEYTTDLLDLLNVLTLLVELEPEQASLLDKVCNGPLVSEAELQAEGALGAPPAGIVVEDSNEKVQQGLF
ncbi:type ISP restriction/modification enzyme [Lysobacter changpingensis]|uniref:type ISP restriction/modification enzyme n=1 Tax=Lysobacter changpingensis TaxID=2792784 RepID=UPI001A8CB488|nr:type ISP restriction/modification enzyme [Lysobacter changpingensis]